MAFLDFADLANPALLFFLSYPRSCDVQYYGCAAKVRYRPFFELCSPSLPFSPNFSSLSFLTRLVLLEEEEEEELNVVETKSKANGRFRLDLSARKFAPPIPPFQMLLSLRQRVKEIGTFFLRLRWFPLPHLLQLKI